MVTDNTTPELSSINPLDYITEAPCYFRVRNDGALWRCSDCAELKVYSQIYCTVVPNGKVNITCKDCIDDTWLANAKLIKVRL